MFLRRGGERKFVLDRHYGKTPEERFWLYTKQQKKGCWEWTGYKNDKGYGVLNLGGERVLAHRFAYQMVEPIPDGMFVLHRCDNPGCVRVKHLFLGTKADNNADMMAKGRARGPSMKGIRNPSVKLSEIDVKAIRASAEPGIVLAARYNIANGQISAIRRRKTWDHLPSSEGDQPVKERLGEGHHNAILTERDVRSIRASSETSRAMATQYGVSISTIQKIRLRLLWKHIE